MFLVNSRFRLVSATRQLQEQVPHQRAPLLPKLRGQFAEFLNQSSLDRLGILYLTTCVGLRYGQPDISLEAFLGSMESLTSPNRLAITSQAYELRICLQHSPTRLAPAHSTPSARPILLRPPIATNELVGWYRNINPLSIDYAFRPRLRSRLTLSGLALPQETLVIRRTGFSPVFRYSCLHSHFCSAPRCPPVRFARHTNAPLPIHTTEGIGMPQLR